MEYEVLINLEKDFMEVILDTNKFTLAFDINPNTQSVRGIVVVYTNTDVERKVALYAINRLIKTMFQDVRYFENEDVPTMLSFTGTTAIVDKEELIETFTEYLKNNISKHFLN